MSRYSSAPRPAPCTQVRLWDGRWWPCAGRYAAAPVFRYGWAPTGLATVRQLAAQGLRPAGQDVAGWLVWGPANRPRWAYLYRLDLARPKRPMTAARWVGIERANAAQRVCPTCGGDDGYRIPRSLGECWPCAALRKAEHERIEHERIDNERDEHDPAGAPATTRTSETRSAA